MAEIKMTRVDFRLVHGQIVVKWCKACDVDKIVVIDDVVASDDFMSQIYASSAPAGVVVKSYSQEKAKRLWEKNRFGEKSKVLILFKDIDTCYAMIKGGMELKSVQLGGVPQMGDRRAVKRAVFLGEKEMQQLKELHDMGFDEVAFSYLQQPLAATELKYASQSGTPSRTDAVVSLAKYLRANLTATGLRVSAIVSADSILQDKAAQSGQDMTVFPKLFDRVCVFATTDNVSTLQSAIAADSSFDAATRFVPFLTQAPESGSYVTTG